MVTRRGFLASTLALGAATAAASLSSPYAYGQNQFQLLTDFGAVPDGVYDPVSRRASGTDNTNAINAALATGRPVLIPAGFFYYTGMLYTDTNGSGLIGSGDKSSFLVTDRSRARHLAVVSGTSDTTWVNFGMLGPFATEGDEFNRALTIGVRNAFADVPGAEWDAGNTWIDRFSTYGYCVGLHIARADNVRFGLVEVFEAGDSRAEPGSYGITCSGSGLRGQVLRAINTTTRARHALYYTGPANDCFVDTVEAKGFDFAPIRNRATDGGGRGNGFGVASFEDCNTNSQVEPGTVRGLVDFVCANDVEVAGAGYAQIGDYVATDCGGSPGPSLRYMPNSRCGTVHAYRHSYVGDRMRRGAHIYRSENVELPTLLIESCSDPQYLDENNADPMVIEDSPGCYGGGVQCLPT